MDASTNTRAGSLAEWYLFDVASSTLVHVESGNHSDSMPTQQAATME